MNIDRPAAKQYETWLKQLLQRRFEQARFKVEKELTVGELPQRIDMIASDEVAAQHAELPEIFRHFRRYNVMELKSEADDLTPEDLLKLHAYGWHYMELKRIYTIAEVTLTAVVHHLTPAVLKVLPTLGYVPTAKGIYRQAPSAMESRLICFKELPDEMTPEELRAFSNPARRQPLILSELERGKLTPLLEALLELYESEVFKIMALKQETIQRYIDALGPEKFIAALRKEDILATLRKEDLLAILRKEDMLATLRKEDMLATLRKEDLLAALSKEDVLQYFFADLSSDQLQQLLAQIKGGKSESH